MTTIAFNYKDKEIAVDSRMTKGSFISNDNANKVNIVNGVTFVLCGAVNEIEKVCSKWPELQSSVNCCGFAIVGGSVKWLTNSQGLMTVEDCNYNETAGSGGDYAITAMDMGATAKEAVKMAMKRDSNTGGKIRVIKVK